MTSTILMMMKEPIGASAQVRGRRRLRTYLLLACSHCSMSHPEQISGAAREQRAYQNKNGRKRPNGRAWSAGAEHRLILQAIGGGSFRRGGEKETVIAVERSSMRRRIDEAAHRAFACIKNPALPTGAVFLSTHPRTDQTSISARTRLVRGAHAYPD
jgi:hypothetical protein